MTIAPETDRIMDACAPDCVAVAAAHLAAGNLVALPTETVYGLGADATQGQAVAAVFAAKHRPQFNPLIAHVDGLAMALCVARFDPLSRLLAERFWPGPLTLVLPLAEGHGLHPLVTAGLETVAVRQPQGIMADIITALGKPVAAPSANRSGRLSPTRAGAVAQSLGADAPLIIDGGPCRVGVESTIIAVVNGALHLLRPGGIAVEAIEAVSGQTVANTIAKGGPVQAPGQLLSHYAPRARIRLGATHIDPGEAFLAFGDEAVPGAATACAVRNLSASGDLVEAAANLFAMLDELDATEADCIAIAPIPEDGLGRAINDRLRRAAAPRDMPVTNRAETAHG